MVLINEFGSLDSDSDTRFKLRLTIGRVITLTSSTRLQALVRKVRANGIKEFLRNATLHNATIGPMKEASVLAFAGDRLVYQVEELTVVVVIRHRID